MQSHGDSEKHEASVWMSTSTAQTERYDTRRYSPFWLSHVCEKQGGVLGRSAQPNDDLHTLENLATTVDNRFELGVGD